MKNGTFARYRSDGTALYWWGNANVPKDVLDRVTAQRDKRNGEPVGNPTRNSGIYKDQYDFRMEHGGSLADAKLAWFTKTGKEWLTPSQIPFAEGGIVPFDPWAEFAEYREPWKAEEAKKGKTNPRLTPRDTSNRKKRKRHDPTDPFADIPGYVVYGLKQRAGMQCAVLHATEGVHCYRKPGASMWHVIKLVPDHIIPTQRGGRTVPGNIRVISNLANSLKSDGLDTDEDIRSRVVEAGYEILEIPADIQKILRDYGVLV